MSLKRKTIITAIFLVLSLLLLINTSLALESNLESNIELKTEQNQEIVCPCTLVKYHLSLKNIGTFPEEYSLSLEKPLSKWSSLSSEKITLVPGQETLIELQIQPDCSIYGNYTSIFKVTAETTKLAAKMPLSLKILPCYSYDILPGDYYPVEDGEKLLFRQHYTDHYELCEKEPVTLPILIDNTAPIPNRFDFEFYGPEWTSIDETRFVIGRKNSSIIDLSADVPAGLEENYTLALESESYWGDIDTRKEINISVVWCYTPLIKTKKVKINYTQDLTTPIEIYNQGTRTAKYSFELTESPSWISLETNNLTLLPNETKELNLISNPPEDTKQDDYNVLISAKAQNDAEYESLLTVNLRKKGIFSWIKAHPLTSSVVFVLLVLLIFLITRIKIISDEDEAEESINPEKEFTKEEKKKAEKLRKEEEKKAKEEEEREKAEKEEKKKAALEEKEEKARKKEESREDKHGAWKYILAMAVIIIILLFALSYSLIPEVFSGNFTSITLFPELLPGEGLGENITGLEAGISESQDSAPNVHEIPQETPTETAGDPSGEETSLLSKIKTYSYYLGFLIILLVITLLILRSLKKGKDKKIGRAHV